jgi:hypothetical protein
MSTVPIMYIGPVFRLKVPSCEVTDMVMFRVVVLTALVSSVAAAQTPPIDRSSAEAWNL